MAEIYYYDYVFNTKDPKEGEHKGNISQKEEYNIDTAQENHAHNDEWNKQINDRQTKTFDPGLAASNEA